MLENQLATAKDIVNYYRQANTKDLAQKADAVARQHHHDTVWLRGLIEFSNHCHVDCLYCGIRKSNEKVHRYRLTEEQIVEVAKQGYDAGLRTIVLQGGEDAYYTTDRMTRIIEQVKAITNHEAAITLSCGIRSYQTYKKWKEAGADRYLIRFETSNPELHKHLRNGLELEKRLEALRNLKDCGYQTGSGYMVGLPGENEETRINNALLCHDLQLDMVGIGCFIPHQDTPLANAPQEPLDLTIRAVALTRLLLPKAHMPATTAVGSLDPRGREKVMRAGANVLMPNITPVDVKANYLLYPGKVCLDESGLECISCLDIRTHAINKKIMNGKGDALP